MESVQATDDVATFDVQKIGGIDETTVEIPPGVTVLTGRNATNRTSFMQAVMAAVGSNKTSLKGDAEEGYVELAFGGETYTRTLTRTADGVASTGDPYLDDPTVADLFAFLLESNEARRAVARGDDLRELIMRPVDTDAIQAEIRRLESERDRIDDQLDELESLKGELPDLESRRAELEGEIEEKREQLQEREADIADHDATVDEGRDEKEELESRLEELRERRSDLDRVRSDVDVQQDSIESLRTERRDLEGELEDLPDRTDDGDDLEDELGRLRDRKSRLESDVSDLQDLIQFNEEMLEGDESALAGALGADENASDGSLTDQLVADESVTCWTCGSAVERKRIEGTLDRLRERRRETLQEVRELDEELEDLESERQRRADDRQRRETVQRKLETVTDELEERRDRLETLREERDRLNEEVEDLETAVENLETDDFSEVLDLHRQANELEFEIGRRESTLDEVADRIATIEDRLAEQQQLEARREEIGDELTDLRTRIDRIEEEAIEQFNQHMDSVLEILGYENLERIWIERVERSVREGRRKVDRTLFELHVVRSTSSGASYEDTIDHLSESEREVTGLVFALAGYLVHDLHETVPFMLLDSLEAIDSDRLADLVEYIADYAEYLVVALLPEDAQALDDDYHRITEI